MLLSSVWNALCIISLLLVYPPPVQGTICPRLIHILGNSTDVTKMAVDLRDFADGSSGAYQGIVANELVQRLEEATTASDTQTLSLLVGTTNLDRINEAVEVIQNSVSDLKNLVLNVDGPLEETYKQYFIEGFRSSQISKHIRFIPELPTYILPEFNVPLLDQLKAISGCDNANIGSFHWFYVNLLSNAIALQTKFVRLTSNLTLDTVLETEWRENLDKVQASFYDLEINCYNELLGEAIAWRGHVSGASFQIGTWMALVPIIVAVILLK